MRLDAHPRRGAAVVGITAPLRRQPGGPDKDFNLERYEAFVQTWVHGQSIERDDALFLHLPTDKVDVLGGQTRTAVYAGLGLYRAISLMEKTVAKNLGSKLPTTAGSGVFRDISATLSSNSSLMSLLTDTCATSGARQQFQDDVSSFGFVLNPDPPPSWPDGAVCT